MYLYTKYSYTLKFCLSNYPKEDNWTKMDYKLMFLVFMYATGHLKKRQLIIHLLIIHLSAQEKEE